MQPVTQFNKQVCGDLREDLNKALASVAEKYGIELTARNISFSPKNAKITLEAATLSVDGTVNRREADIFKQFSGLFGLEADDLGKTFEHAGATYKITGLNPRAPKMPVTAERVSDGKPIKASAELVLQALKRDPRRAAVHRMASEVVLGKRI